MRGRGGMKVRFAVQKEDERGRMGGKEGGGGVYCIKQYKLPSNDAW